MNKNKFTEFFKGKGYYVLLFIGVLAIAAVALLGSQLSANNKNGKQDNVDLNETEDNIAAKDGDTELAENNPVSDGVVNNGDNSTEGTAANDDAAQDVAGKSNQVELEGYGEETGKGTDDAQAAEEAAAAVETEGTTVQADTAALDNLSFEADDGLLWPVEGNVIMNYSMEHTIYFATLMEYKCNPAIIIDAEVGTAVKAAADGIITGIDNNEETGCTITMGIGDGYSLVYGQLNKDSVSMKVGEKVKEGEVIGAIAEPTKYYTVEGSNLYFQVMEEDKTVDPMLLLRDNE